MSRDDINRYLTEQMGDYFHEIKHILTEPHGNEERAECSCSEQFRSNYELDLHHRIYNENFIEDWRSFGKLWEWAKEQDWWEEFLDYYGLDTGYSNPNAPRPLYWPHFINPDRFATAVAEFLKERGK